MLPSTGKRNSFSALLLTTLLSGFCAGAAVETAEAESTSIEVEEIILGRGLDERTSSRLAELARKSLTDSRPSDSRCSLLPASICNTEHSSRNGIGRPLTL